jgi:hypothetical protein
VYYFGVQGGIRQFEEFLTKTNLFKTRVIRVIDASNIKQIISYKSNFFFLLLYRC